MRLFRSPFDQINLLFPVILLGLSGVEYLFGDRGLWRYSSFLRYVQDIVFFNGLHVCLTFIFLASTTTGRETYGLFIGKMGNFGIARVAIVFLGTTFIYYCIFAFLPADGVWQLAFLFGLDALKRKHNLGQSKGLLRIANRQVINDSVSNDWISFDRIQLLEHYLINIFYFSSTIAGFTFFTYGLDFGYFGKILFQVSMTLSLLIAGALSLCAVLSPRGSRKWKLLFSTRFYLKTIGPFSALAAYGGAAVHGVEYLFVTDKVIESERKKGRFSLSSPVFVGTIALVFCAFAVLGYPEFFFSSLKRAESAALMSVAAGIVLTHFFVDYLIFTPKHDFAKPLLKVLGSPASEQTASPTIPKNST